MELFRHSISESLGEESFDKQLERINYAIQHMVYQQIPEHSPQSSHRFRNSSSFGQTFSLSEDENDSLLASCEVLSEKHSNPSLKFKVTISRSELHDALSQLNLYAHLVDEGAIETGELKLGNAKVELICKGECLEFIDKTALFRNLTQTFKENSTEILQEETSDSLSTDNSQSSAPPSGLLEMQVKHLFEVKNLYKKLTTDLEWAATSKSLVNSDLNTRKVSTVSKRLQGVIERLAQEQPPLEKETEKTLTEKLQKLERKRALLPNNSKLEIEIGKVKTALSGLKVRSLVRDSHYSKEYLEMNKDNEKLTEQLKKAQANLKLFEKTTRRKEHRLAWLFSQVENGKKEALEEVFEELNRQKLEAKASQDAADAQLQVLIAKTQKVTKKHCKLSMALAKAEEQTSRFNFIKLTEISELRELVRELDCVCN